MVYLAINQIILIFKKTEIMDLITISLISALFFALVSIILLDFKNSALSEKNKLYLEFTKRTSVRKFIAILDGVSSKILDSDIMLMLQKYFELVLLRLDKYEVLTLLVDLGKSKHSGVLKQSLINAIVKKDDYVFGLALSVNFNNSENKLAIENFLESLPEECKKKQYQAAFNTLKEDYDRKMWDYPSEYRAPVEKAMKEFEKRFL